MNVWHFFTQSWNWDPLLLLVCVGLLAAVWRYGAGLRARTTWLALLGVALLFLV